MSAQALLAKIRSNWLHRVAHSMARGEDVRANFEKELEQFFSLLEQAVATGDPAWLDSILYEWTGSPTQSDLEQGKNNVTLLLGKMIAVTNEVARESLTESEALDLLTELIPIYTHLLDKAARLEMETRITYISKELVNVQQQLEKLDRTKSNFISVAAHELKTPLTLIEGYTTMMRDMIDASGQNQFDSLLVGMNKGVRRLHEIIDDMIDVSLIDNNLLSLNFQRITLMHILNLLKGELDESVSERKQTLDIKKFPGIETWIYADSERLYQALHNVLDQCDQVHARSGQNHCRRTHPTRFYRDHGERYRDRRCPGKSYGHLREVRPTWPSQPALQREDQVQRRRTRVGACQLRAVSSKPMAARSGSNQKAMMKKNFRVRPFTS